MALPSWLIVLLAILSTTRLTRLVTTDVILDRPRAWVQAHKPAGPLAYFVQCPWCVSIWLGGAVAAGTYYGHRLAVVLILLIALSASWLTGLLAHVAAKLED